MNSDQDHDYDTGDDGNSVSSEGSSKSGGSSGINGSKGNESSSSGKELRDKIIKKEEKAVNRARIFVVLAVLIAAVSVTVAVYFFSSQSDYNAFRIEYESFATSITTLVNWEVNYNFALMQQMSTTVTSAAIMLNETFPFVTLPHYEIPAGYVDGVRFSGARNIPVYHPTLPQLDDSPSHFSPFSFYFSY